MSRGSNIEQRHELPIDQQIVDPRPFAEKFAEWLTIPSNMMTVVVPVALLTMAVPVLGIITLPALLFITVAHFGTKELLPVRYPIDAKDPKGNAGNGIMYVGEVASKSPFENFKEIWLSDDDLRKHMLILGSTGSGKSEALKSIFFNALNWSSGFFIADGKADNKLPTDVYTMARSNGRDQDVLYLNFLLAGKTPEQVRLSRRRRTNKLNPFPSADSDTIIQMGANLLPKVEGDAKNWQEKALNLWRSVVAACCYKRDTNGFDLSVATFIDYMSLNKVEELYMEGYEESQARNGEWSYGYAGIKNYLESGCPAYQVSKLLKKHGYAEEADSAAAFGNARPAGKRGGKEFEQDSMAYEQHSYRTNQLMPVLNLLDKTYGFIFRDKYPEIDMTDVTLRNRILVMLIPSLEKSAAEAENLGKLAIACLRVMMSKNLGAEVEGSHDELLGSKATNSPYPYVVALDELAYYFSDGIAVMFAQARSLGVCMIAAAQDLEKLTEGSKSAEAGAMLANQVTKFFMRIDDTGKTSEMIQKVVGKAMVAVRRTFRFTSMGYSRKGNIEVIEVDRVSTSKLQAFGQGEGIVNAIGRTYFMRWFYMGKDIDEHRVDGYYVNRFLQVAPPSKEEVTARSIAVDDINDPYRRGKVLLSKLKQEIDVELNYEFDPVLSALQNEAGNINEHVTPEERLILLYQAAKTAVIEQENQVASSGSTGAFRSKGEAQKQTPIVSPPVSSGIVEPDVAVIDEGVVPLEGDIVADDDEGVLSFLSLTPFERKPAKDVLGFGDASVEDSAVKASPQVAMLDPVQALMAGGQTLKLTSDLVLRGKVLSQLVGAPDAKDPVTGLPLVPKDDWIGDALRESMQILTTPRSSDNTVIGFTTKTLEVVAAVEALMNSPAPDIAARSLERVIASRVTPDTKAQSPIGEEIDEFFLELEQKLR